MSREVPGVEVAWFESALSLTWHGGCRHENWLARSLSAAERLSTFVFADDALLLCANTV